MKETIIAGPAEILLIALVTELRRFKEWQTMPEAQQQMAIDRMADGVREAFREAAHNLAAAEFAHHQVTIKSLSITDAAKLVLTVPMENISDLVPHISRSALLVLTPSTEDYLASLERVRADPQQPALALGDPDAPRPELTPPPAIEGQIVYEGRKWREDSADQGVEYHLVHALVSELGTACGMEVLPQNQGDIFEDATTNVDCKDCIDILAPDADQDGAEL